MKIKLKTIYSLRVRFVVKINNKQYLYNLNKTLYNKNCHEFQKQLSPFFLLGLHRKIIEVKKSRTRVSIQIHDFRIKCVSIQVEV